MSSSNRRAVRQGDIVQFEVRTRTVVRVLLVATVFYAAIRLVTELAPFLLTLLVAAFLAIAADPAVRWLESKGLARGAAVGVLFLATLLALTAAVFVFVPPLVDQGQNLIAVAPEAVQQVREHPTYERLDERYDVVDKVARQVQGLPGMISSEIGGLLTAVLAGVFGTVTIIFMVVLLLLGGDTLVGGIARLFPQITERRTWRVVQGAYRSIGAYVAGTFLVALIAGTTMLLALLLLDLPYAAPLALWMMLLAMVPLVGASIGALPAIIVAFSVGGLVQGIVLLVFVIVYQQVENLVIQPTIQGRIVSLPPLIIFLAVLVGSQLLGVLGALFAVPIAGITQIVLKEWLEFRGQDGVELPPIAPENAPEPPGLDAERETEQGPLDPLPPEPPDLGGRD